MSKTVSKGFITISHWLSVVSAAREYVEKYSTQIWTPSAAELHAIERISYFFDCVFEGIAIDNRQSLNPEIPSMAAICNYSFAVEIFNGHLGNSSHTLLMARIKLFRQVLRRMTKNETVHPAKLLKLQLFLEEFERQAQADRDSRVLI